MDANAKDKGLSKTWIVGNKIVQIRTGLFSNICNEELAAMTGLPLSRKTKLTTTTTTATPTMNTISNVSEKRSTAINIPHSALIVATANNDSLASSEDSSNISNNNSFSSNQAGNTGELGSSAASSVKERTLLAATKPIANSNDNASETNSLSSANNKEVK